MLPSLDTKVAASVLSLIAVAETTVSSLVVPVLPANAALTAAIAEFEVNVAPA